VVFTFKRSSSSCCLRTTRTVCTPLEDGPRGGFQPAVHRVLREFLRAIHSIHFVSGFLLHEVCGRSVLECQTVRDGADDSRAHRRWSVIWGAVLEVHESFSDSPLLPCGRSAETTRTVRPEIADSLPGTVQDSYVLCFLIRAFASGLFGVCS
jgi:hypothetical protein